MTSTENTPAQGVYPFLDLSTGHIEQADSAMLDQMADLPEFDQPVVVIKRTFGWLVRVPALEIEATLANCVKQGLSEMFIGVLRYAIQHECWWVHIDADAVIVDALPFEEW